MVKEFFEGRPEWARRRIAIGELPTGPQWAKVISSAGGNPLPEDLRRHLARFLKSVEPIANRRGRKRKQFSPLDALTLIHQRIAYQRALKRYRHLLKRKKEEDPRGKKVKMRGSETAQDLALMEVRQHYPGLRYVSLGTLRNRLSKSGFAPDHENS